jgi:tetraacyldisaccharide 4'-kinase
MSQPSSARRLLLPLVPLYRLALAFRELRLLLEPARRLRFPVVSIGNLSTGGAGKTPLTIALAQALSARGLRVDVLSRGYGRQSKLAARVLPDGSAEDFGDEPLLIARETGVPVYVSAQRYDAGLLAELDARTKAPCISAPCPILSRSMRKGGKPRTTTDDEENHQLIVHLLDDGFQHRQLARDVDILMLNKRDWQDWLLPAGNLREPLKAIHRASVIAIPANEPELEAALHVWGWNGPVWRLHRTMDIPAVSGPVAAFCGIARPQQFFAGLEDAGLEVALQLAFPDHFTYTRRVLEELIANAREKEATAIITTEKDLIRLGNLVSIFPQSMPLVTGRLRIKIENQAEAIDWLEDRVRQSSTAE